VVPDLPEKKNLLERGKSLEKEKVLNHPRIGEPLNA